MEPFRVTCETCRARLKVRNASAIGEIHACPKCGSMVHIAPPADWSAEAVPAAPAVVLAAAATPEPDFTHVAPPSDALANMFEAAAAAASVPDVLNRSAEVASHEIAPPAPSPPLAGSPYVLWSVVGSAAILIGGLTVVMWPDKDLPAPKPAPPFAAAAVAPLSPEAEPIEDPPTANEQASEPRGEPHLVAKPAIEDVGRVGTETEPTTLPELPAEDVTGTNVADQQASEAQTEVVAAEVDAPPAESVAAAGDAPRSPVMKFDPLDFDPSQFSLDTSAPPDPPTNSVADSTPGEAAAETAAALETPEAEEANLLPAQPVNPTISVRLGPLPDYAMRHDPADQLALEVESLDVADMPLVRFIDTLSDLSGLPITLDPVGLELAGISPRSEITLAVRDVTLDALLRDRLRASRLNCVEEDGHAIIELAEADRRSSRELEVRDLMEPGATDAQAVSDLIQTFVSPESWPSASGAAPIAVNGSKLTVEQSKAVQHETLLFCERLRMARGLSRKSRYPAELLSIDSPYEKLEAKLAETTTFTFLPWTRLSDVLRHWQDASGITMLADWHHLADLELGPSTPVACSAVDRTWRDVLDEMLEPLGLAWWPVDATTIQITSREALDTIFRVEFYDVPKQVRDQFASGDALLETLRSELSENAGDKSASAAQLKMQLDGASRRLIVRGTPPVHRFLSARLGSAE